MVRERKRKRERREEGRVRKKSCPPLHCYKDQAFGPCSRPPTVRGIQDGKKQEALCALDTDPLDSEVTYLRKSFNDPRFLHLSIRRKAN